MNRSVDRRRKAGCCWCPSSRWRPTPTPAPGLRSRRPPARRRAAPVRSFRAPGPGQPWQGGNRPVRRRHESVADQRWSGHFLAAVDPASRKLKPVPQRAVNTMGGREVAMKIWSDSFTEGGVIPPECAFARDRPGQRTCGCRSNRNPHLAWDDVPAGTQSLVLLVPRRRRAHRRHRRQPGGQERARGRCRAPISTTGRWSTSRSRCKSHRRRAVFRHGHARTAKPGPTGALPRQERHRAPAAPGHQRLHRLVRGRPGHGRRILRLRRPVPAMERPARAHLCVQHCMRSTSRACRSKAASPAPKRALAIRGHILDEAQIFGVYSLNPDDRADTCALIPPAATGDLRTHASTTPHRSS